MAGSQRHIVVNRLFVDYMGDLHSGIFLSQLLYWFDRTENPYVAKSSKEWHEEIALSEYQCKKATKVLVDKGFLAVKVKKFAGVPTKHYFLDGELFASDFMQWLDKIESPKMQVEKKKIDYNKGKYRQFVDAYFLWFEQQNGVKPPFDKVQGQAMKKIITYFESNSKGDSLGAWNFLLHNWWKLDEFYRKQVKVTQILSNLPNIITQFKNGSVKNNATASQAINEWS